MAEALAAVTVQPDLQHNLICMHQAVCALAKLSCQSVFLSGYLQGPCVACPLWWPGCNLGSERDSSSLSLKAVHAAGVPTVVARRTLPAGNNLIGRLVATADEAIKAAVEGAGLIVLQVSLNTHCCAGREAQSSCLHI